MLALYFYRVLWVVLSPLVDLMFIIRLIKGKEDKKRIPERLGISKVARPNGKLLWLHAASVGESLSILPLIRTLQERQPSLHILVTTGTVTSAELMAKRLPQNVVHQFVPLDFYWSVKNFIRHWQPDLSVFVESELWPELLHQAPNPIIINGRMSEKSAARYQKFAPLTGFMFQKIRLILAQSEESYSNFQKVCNSPLENSGNLKFDAPKPPADFEELEALQQQLQNHKLFVCASTHPGEDEVMAAIHQRAKAEVKNLITVIVPRHPHRGKSIQKQLQKAGYTCNLRSAGEPIENIYIADTIGELGLWYRLANVVLMGKSLHSGGGQNPFEPLKCGKVTLTGPSMENFTEMMQIFKEREIILQSENVAQIEKDLVYFLKNDKQRTLAEEKITEKMQNLGGATAKTAQRIEDFLV